MAACLFCESPLDLDPSLLRSTFITRFPFGVDDSGGEEAKGRLIKTVASLLGGRTALLGGVALVHSAQTAFIFSAGILPDKNSSLYN